MLSAVGCGSNAPSAPNVDATVAAAVAATRTANDVQQKVAATMSAPTATTESASPVKKVIDKGEVFRAAGIMVTDDSH